MDGDFNVKSVLPGEVRWNPEPTKELKSSNPKDRAATSRLDLTLFPQTAIAYGSLAMTEGHCKYGGYNYRVAGAGVSTYIAAAFRHLFDFYNGEWADKKSLVPHLGSALADIGVMIDSYERGNLLDDRPPRIEMSELLSNFQHIVEHLQKTFPNGPDRCAQRSIAPITTEVTCDKDSHRVSLRDDPCKRPPI